MKVKTYQKYSNLKKMARFISIGIHNRTPGEPINLCVPVRFMTGNQKQNKTTSLILWVFISCHETNASNRTSIQFLVHLKDFSMSHLRNCLCSINRKHACMSTDTHFHGISHSNNINKGGVHLVSQWKQIRG